MKKISLVKLSLATIVMAIALTITPNKEIKASADESIDPPSHLVWDGKACSNNTLSQCAPGS